MAKKKIFCDLKEKCLRNSKIFFDGVFISIYSHFVKKLELSKLRRKKLWGSKNGIEQKGMTFDHDFLYDIVYQQQHKS